MNPLPLLELLLWRRDLPPLGLPVILLRAGPACCPCVATWTECDGWGGGGYYETWCPDEHGCPESYGLVPRAEIASAGWEWMAVGVQG